MKKLTAVLIFLLIPSVLLATNYYVDGTNGNDTSNTGLSIDNAFKTIQKAVNTVSAAGDNVIIKAGVYREAVSKTGGANGTSSNPITIKPYGNGEVVIDGSTAVTSWTNISGQIYRATPGFVVGAVVVDNVPLFPVAPLHLTNKYGCAAPYDTYAGTAGLWQEGRYLYETSTGYLYVWAPGGGNPSTHTELGVLKTTRSTNGALYFWNRNYWVVDGITLRFSDNYGLAILGDAGFVSDITLKNSVVKFNWWGGVMNVKTAINNVVYHNVLTNWPRGRPTWGADGGGWAGGLNISSTNGLADNNTAYMNGGEGIIAYNSPAGYGGTTFRNNTSYNNYSVQMYFDSMPNSVMENNFLYAQPDNVWKTNNNGTAYDLGISKRMYGQCLMVANEGLGGYCSLDNIIVRNNIVAGCASGISYFYESTCNTTGMKNVKIYNNTIVVPNARQPYLFGDPNHSDNYKGFKIYWVSNTTGNEIKNNIVYAYDSYSFTLQLNGKSDADVGILFDNNIVYHPNRSSNIWWGGSILTHAQWVALAGPSHGTGDILADPLLVSPYGYTKTSYRVDSSSPAIDSGITTSDVTTDYWGTSRPYGSGYDIGAHEWSESTPVLITPAAGATAGWPVVFTWSAVDNTDAGYNIQVDNNSDFSSPEINDTISCPSLICTSAERTLSENCCARIQAGTRYYWRVRAIR